MSIFIGSNAGETIEPGFISPIVAVLGHVKSPSAASDIIFAGDGNDRVAGGGGDDIAFLGGGDDLFTWNSGDGSDFVDGGSGTDTLAFNGSAAAETIKLSTGLLGTLRVSDNVEHASMTLIGMERIVVSAGAGDDVVDASALPAGHVSLEIFGGLGSDTLIGSAGNDFINGGDGNDLALMGAGDDTFVWNPGDDNDTVDGQAGLDTLAFNGANIAEQVDVLANGSRALFTRNVAAITMDLNSVEHINFNALGGADIVTVHNMAGTGVTEVNIDLAGTVGGATGDGAADQVIVQGTSGNDVIHAAANGTSASVTGLAAVTNVTNIEAIDQLIVDGGAGNDTLIGGAGTQVLHGGEGDDLLTGGAGDDQMFGDAGNDRMVWNPGDGTDLMEGGDGKDTAEVNGGNGAEVFAVTANGTRVRLDRISPAPFSLDIGTTEKLVVNMNGGDDSFSATGNLATLIGVIVDGGAGNDTILGSNGADLLIGGDGNDFIDGNQGADTAQLGAGDDTFQWDPGDGSDVVDGQDGFDTLAFNGANIAEQVDVLASGSHALFTRDVAAITMDLNNLERIDFNALGGADMVTVHDMTGTSVTEVNIDLAATGGTTGDGAADQVIVQGTSGNDVIHDAANGSSASVTGLAAITNVTNLEAIDQLIVDGGAGNDTLIGGAGTQVLHGGEGDDLLAGGAGDDQMFGDAGNDRMVWNPGDGTDLMEGGDGSDTAEVNGGNGAEVFSATANGTRVRFDRISPAPFSLDIGTTEKLVVNMNGGDDSFSATGNLSTLINVTVDGGAGNDTILGSNGADLLIGGDGNDFIDGNQGADIAQLGAGDDTFQWDPGDGSDSVEGQDGFDTLAFNGANIAEQVDVLANGTRTLFTRNVAAITMDLNGMERIDFNALGGADIVNVHDLSATGVTEVNVDLAATVGGATGDGAADQVSVEGTSGNDVVVIAGDTTGISVAGLAAQVNIDGAEGALDRLEVRGGDGDDVLDASRLATGAIGVVLDGGAGNDVILGSAGNDVLRGGEGDDIIIGGGGNDTIDAGPGNNVVIQDFTSGEDRIDLRSIAAAHDFAWVLAHATDVQGSAVIDLGDGADVTLSDVSVASLHANDFLLA